MTKASRKASCSSTASTPDTRADVAGWCFRYPDSQTILERAGDDTAFGCENLSLPKDEIWNRARAALDIVGLDYIGVRPRHTRTFLAGNVSAFALAGVLAMHPGLLLLDEPTANLDPDGVKEVHDAVRHVLEQTHETLVVVEHHIDVWLDLVDRVIVLGKPEADSNVGGVIADGTPERSVRPHGSGACRRRCVGAGPHHRKPRAQTGTNPATAGRRALHARI